MEIDLLKQSPIFARLSSNDLATLKHAMQVHEFFPNEIIWHEGTPAEALGFVVSGALEPRVGVQAVGTVRPGELVGEAGAFFADPRMASIVATERSTLAVLSRETLRSLRETDSRIYDVLLERALEVTARRVQDAGKRVAMLGNGGVEPPVRKAPSALSRLFRVESSSSQPPPHSSILVTLRRIPGLAKAPPTIVSRLGAAFRPRQMKADEILVLEGETGESVFIISEGAVEVVRAVRGGKARRLAVLREGTVFGTGALLLRERRNASIKVTQAGWAWELARTDHDALESDVRRVWMECLLVSLRAQVIDTTKVLAELKGGTSEADRIRLRKATERLVSVNPSEEAVDDPWSYMGKGRP